MQCQVYDWENDKSEMDLSEGSEMYAHMRIWNDFEILFRQFIAWTTKATVKMDATGKFDCIEKK